MVKALARQPATDDRRRSAVPDEKALLSFLSKWAPGGTADRLNERAGAQPHFMDLCHLLDVDTPADPDNYCFERGLWGIERGHRFADVWKRGHFAWEYKAPGGDLNKALAQLMQYALRLDNPPLLIVSDRHTIQIHTHFTGHPSLLFSISHENLREPNKLALLRSAFVAPRNFRPVKTAEQITAELASSFARIAKTLIDRGETPFRSAHFLTQCIFCCFAESTEVLPSNIFRRVVQKRQPPAGLQRRLSQLFEKMGKGGEFGVDTIPWFNGGLFKLIDVPLLIEDEIATLSDAVSLSWAAIDPAILGTLFERGLNPAKRSQMGAHYTDASTIERLVDPVVRRPLLAEWNLIKRGISELMSQRDVLAVRAKGVPSSTPSLKARYGALRSHATQAQKKALALLSGFMDRLQSFRILDPACGSGNFLFLALKALKDIEHQVNLDAEELGLQRQISVTGPHNVLGIEINEYAAELARATVWIGELQWRKEHGYGWKENPILDSLDQIECRDAVLTNDGREAAWPKTDVVIGNPPFVGNKKMLNELGTSYTKSLRAAYKGRVPGAADFVCYWFEKARTQIESQRLLAAGLVATNSIRGGKNRAVIERIFKDSRIFDAWSDQPWVNDGAAVRVSLIAFGTVSGARLDGREVAAIHSDLSAIDHNATGVDLTQASPLGENARACFIGGMKKGLFDVSGDIARRWLLEPNPHGHSNAEVVVPWVNGLDVTRRPSDTWIVDFGVDRPCAEASLFERPYAHVLAKVRPAREQVRNDLERVRWWLHARPAPDLRAAVAPLRRYLGTARVAKHRLFVWLRAPLVVDGQIVVIARADDATMGILQGRFHEVWSLRTCTWMGKGNDPRYTPTSTFETFPFPPGLTPAETADQNTETLPDGVVIPAKPQGAARLHAEVIARAAKHLNDLREQWLNPPEWIQSFEDIAPLGIDYSPYKLRIAAKPGLETKLAKRTLTNLYNEHPPWLAQAHEELNFAVARAYGWLDYAPAMGDDVILRRLLDLNRQRSSAYPIDPQRSLLLLENEGEPDLRRNPIEAAQRMLGPGVHRKRATT